MHRALQNGCGLHITQFVVKRPGTMLCACTSTLCVHALCMPECVCTWAPCACQRACTPTLCMGALCVCVLCVRALCVRGHCVPVGVHGGLVRACMPAYVLCACVGV